MKAESRRNPAVSGDCDSVPGFNLTSRDQGGPAVRSGHGALEGEHRILAATAEPHYSVGDLVTADAVSFRGSEISATSHGRSRPHTIDVFISTDASPDSPPFDTLPGRRMRGRLACHVGRYRGPCLHSRTSVRSLESGQRRTRGQPTPRIRIAGAPFLGSCRSGERALQSFVLTARKHDTRALR